MQIINKWIDNLSIQTNTKRSYKINLQLQQFLTNKRRYQLQHQTYLKNIFFNQKRISKKVLKLSKESEQIQIKHIKYQDKYKNQNKLMLIYNRNDTIFVFIIMLSLLYNNTPIIKSMIFRKSAIVVYILLSMLWSYAYAAVQNILYKQKLFLQQNFLIIQFNICTQHLPIPLKNMSQNFNTEISIRYGPYFHMYSRNSIQKYSFNTITTQFNVLNREIYKNVKQILIPEQLLEIIRSTFLVSLAHRYSYSFVEEGKIIYNDPNDKFCRHHIQEVIRNFLPCANFAGLTQLIQLDSFFIAGSSGKRLYGMEISWKIDGINVKFFGQIQQNGNIQGFRRMKVGEKCLSQSILQMSDPQLNAISLRQIVTDRIKQSFFQQQNVIKHNPKLFAIQQIQGNWYNPSKNLKIQIQTQPIFNNSVITIFQLLPYRAGVTQIILLNYYSDSTKIQHIMKCDLQNNQNQPKYKEKKIYCQVNIFIKNLLLEKSKQKFQVNLLLNNKLICFDNYETIFGGGTQIMNIPFKLQEYQKQSKNVQNKQFYYAGPLSLKTPQPDQSLPFQVITFTLGIFGYLWLSIWRKLSNDLKQAKQGRQNLLQETKN